MGFPKALFWVLCYFWFITYLYLPVPLRTALLFQSVANSSPNQLIEFSPILSSPLCLLVWNSQQFWNLYPGASIILPLWRGEKHNLYQWRVGQSTAVPNISQMSLMHVITEIGCLEQLGNVSIGILESIVYHSSSNLFFPVPPSFDHRPLQLVPARFQACCLLFCGQIDFCGVQ